MMQTAQSREPNTDEQQKEAQKRTEETRQKMEAELQRNAAIAQQQTIEGKVQEVKANERAGASKQAVIDKTSELVMGSVEYDISRTKPLEGLSFVQDQSGKHREQIQRAIHDAAEEILKREEITLANREEARRNLMEREHRAAQLEAERIEAVGGPRVTVMRSEELSNATVETNPQPILSRRRAA